MDKFKHYLLEKKEALDLDTPSGDVWVNIKQNTFSKNRIRGFWMMKYATAAVILLTVLVDNQVGRRNEPFFKKRKIVQHATVYRADTAAFAKNQSASAPHVTQVDTLPAKPIEAKRSSGEQQKNNFTTFKVVYRDTIASRLAQIESMPVYAQDRAYFDVFKEQWKIMNGIETNLNTLDTELAHQYLLRLYRQKMQLLQALKSELEDLNAKAILFKVNNKSSEPFYVNL